MRVLAVGAIILMFVFPVHSQTVGSHQDSPLEEMLSQPGKEQAAEREKAYQKALKSIQPDAPAKTDPWGNVRAQEPVQAKQKSQPK
jgi:hypothetical protein